MKSHKIIYACILGIILLFGLFVIYQRLQAQSEFNTFLKNARLKQNDITYESYEKPFLGDGLIIFGVTIPQLKIVHKVDKLIVRNQGDDIVLQFQGINLDVAQSLYNHYGESFVDIVQKYKPFDDALNNPFISLGLMGYNAIKFDMVLIFNPTMRPRLVNGKISLPKLGEIQVSFVLEPQLDSGYRKNLIYAGYGKIYEISIDIQDTGLFKKYATYLRSLGTPTANGYAKELMRHSGFTRRIEYKPQPSLAPFYKSYVSPGE